MVEAVAAGSLPALPVSDEKHIRQCLRLLEAALPKRASDDLTGKLLVKLYQRKLGTMPTEQVSFLTDTAIAELDWFPTIKQALGIATRWQRDDHATSVLKLARGLSFREHNSRLSDARQRLKTKRCEQSWVDALTHGQAEVLEAESLLWRCRECGSYTQRSQWRKWQEFLANNPESEAA